MRHLKIYNFSFTKHPSFDKLRDQINRGRNAEVSESTMVLIPHESSLCSFLIKHA